MMGLGLFVITLTAAIGVTFERWQEDQASLRDEVEIAAFRLAEDDDPIPAGISLPAGANSFAVTFNNVGEVTGATRPLPDELIEELIEEVWTQTTDVDLLITAELGTDDDPLIVAGTSCVDSDVCDTAIVGSNEQPFGSYLAGHLGWVIGAALAAAGLGLLAARWLVGRSLRPVDAMRGELDRITNTDLERRVPVPDSGDELTLLGESMNATIDRLGSAVSANERFVADAAHELRSPITGVKAALEVERAKKPNSLLDDSIAELDRAARLVDDLLVLARRQSGPTQHADVDLDDVARAAVANLRTRRPDLQIDPSLRPCRVRGNADDLQRIVTNLLDNAARYGNGHIQITTMPSGADEVSLRVADNGPGITLGNRVTIFERFARIDESRARATGGSGLGLAIAKELVEDHGGTIHVSDSDLGGASFDVKLPA